MTYTLNPRYPLLVVDDEPAIVDGFKAILAQMGINNLITCTDSGEAQRTIETTRLEAALLDLTMPNVSGEELLDQIVVSQPEVPVIIVTGTNDVASAVNCMKKGAFDYLVKPVSSDRISSAVGIALRLSDLIRENALLKKEFLPDSVEHPEHFSEIVTSNSAMASIFNYIESVSPTPHPILLTGETGVGKELFARAIHRSSGREGEFVAVNIAGLDDNLFTDTLFGHRKGAYTGAETERQGLIASAAGGTLFLDEIGDLSTPSQVKLLRLIQENEYTPLGADTPVKTDARVVVATNVNLAKGLKDGTFREDLYYRLNTHKITIPALRERLDDLPILVDHFLESTAEALGRKKPTPPRELVQLLSCYSFPGNVRELQAMITDAVSRHTARILSMNSFKEHIGGKISGQTAGEPAAQSEWFKETLPQYAEVKQLLVEEALRRSEGSHSRAAELIGTTRQAVWRQLKK